MGDTSIEWTQRPGTIGKTWNVCRGCSYKSPGCKNCYAARIAGRFSGPGQPFEGLVTIRPRKDGGTRHPETGTQVLGSKAFWNGEVRFVLEKLLDPLRWKKPATIFGNSMSDMFHEGFTNDQISAMYGVAYLCDRHTFQFLTKRPERRRQWFVWVLEQANATRAMTVGDFCAQTLLEQFPIGSKERKLITKAREKRMSSGQTETIGAWPLPNVWEGTSVESDDYTSRIHELLATPATVRFLSLEPLLGSVDLVPFLDPSGVCEHHPSNPCEFCLRSIIWRGRATKPGDPVISDPTIDWVIIGCESGPGMRACETRWIRQIIEDCTLYGVRRFLKQARHRVPNLGITKGEGSDIKGTHGGVITLPYLDGKQYTEYPTSCT